MNRLKLPIVLLFALPTTLLADDRPSLTDIRSRAVITGGSVSAAKAGGDTLVLIGPTHENPQVVGTFQDALGRADWNGWSSVDWTEPAFEDNNWQVSTYYSLGGTYSAYCGDETIPSCGGGDPVGGYGNVWSEVLRWGMTVADPNAPASITVDFTFEVDSEPGYDFLILARELEDEVREDLWSVSGDTTGTAGVPVSYAAGEYSGPFSDEIGIWFVGQTDQGYSDEDCIDPSAGLARIDDVTITADNPTTVYSHDFEDGTLGQFERKFLAAVGNFAHIETRVRDADDCVANISPQVVFFDDGIVQPLTGGSRYIDPEFAYAGGWVVNHTGGISFNDQRHLHNSVVSPPIAWTDPDHDGAWLVFTTMLHMLLDPSGAGVFGEVMIRSTDGDMASLDAAEWQHGGYWYGLGKYYRWGRDVTDLLVPGRTYVQVALGAHEIGYLYGYDGDSGSPAPYYDDVRLISYPYYGPAMTVDTQVLPSDAFPEIGTVDTVDLSRNSIRFDQTRIIDPWLGSSHRGDSIVIDVVSPRAGAHMWENPTFHYKLERNPLFDAHRIAGLPDSGMVVMDTTRTPTGTPIAGRFQVDLPDTGFLFPGDVLHYYFSATDAIGGLGGTDEFTTTIPPDITGWSAFGDPMGWSDEFTVHCLPTVTETSPGVYEVPSFLFWDDADSEATGIREEWYDIFRKLNLEPGEDMDVFYSKAPTLYYSGSGLGGRATPAQLALYDELVYTCGELSTSTLCNGDPTRGASDDLGLLKAWLNEGNKDLFLSGDNLAFSLSGGDTASGLFLTGRMDVTFNVADHRALLGGQHAPLVLPLAPPSGPPVFQPSDPPWIAWGSCPDMWEFDLVTVTGVATRLAVWANAAGVDGQFPWSPMSLAEHSNGSRVISITQDLAHIHTFGTNGLGIPARALILMRVLEHFGLPSPALGPSNVPNAEIFAVNNAPNPFNPVTRIDYSIRQPGHLRLKIYNVRGELVRTLVDTHVETAGHVIWDGTDTDGAQVASGVYFYVARMGNELRTGKMALVK